MKNFITSMLGALVALIVFTVCGLLLFVGIVGAVVSAGLRNAPDRAARVESGSYLVFDLSTNITDAPPLYDLSGLTDTGPQTLQLRTATRAIRAASSDSRIAGILLKGSLQPQGFGSGYGALQEVRAALLRFRNGGKPVKAYLELATTRDYYLASVADEVTLDPYGMIYMPGLASQPMFFAGLFEKYGVGVQVTRAGKYKSYVEPYTRKDMSPENREETQRLLDDLWASIISDVGKSRKLAPARVQATVDAEGLIRPEAAKAGGLVDKVAYRDQVIDALKAETGKGSNKDSFKQISLADYAALLPDHAVRASGRAVAIVYAEGEIVDGEGEPGQIGGVAYAREIRKLRQDKDVKAIVLRVNSPGGSATAAEAIQRELRLARQSKPVIVSMGAYAASGGYWISAYGDRIFALPKTITGSIGVFGMQFDVQKLAGDFGITFDRVKTGKYADALTITRPKTEEEMAVMQRLVDWIYGEFKTKVAEGRKLKPDEVERIAQGRVWSGSEALKLGLVDEFGGLEAAVRYAAKQAGLGEGFRLIEYPEKRDLFQIVSDLVGRAVPDASRETEKGLVGQVEKTLESELRQLKAFNDPQGVYARMPIDLAIR